MASSSSSSSVQQKFQVFLSFRGEDTRANFTSHLHAALKRKGIDTYIDDRLEKGEEISEVLLKVIEESTILIIILSKDYASSSWCLDELSKILECKKTMGQKVIPIFYHVDPSDVRKQRGSFEASFAKQQERFKDRTDKVESWRAALVQVASLAGHHLQGHELESEVVEKIANDISQILMRKSFVGTKQFVGIESRLEEIESLLCFDSKDVRIVGIWGMGGIGKTTIAEVIFNRFSAEFEGHCFVNVTEELKHGEDHLRQKLFSEILRDKNLNVGTSSLPAFIFDRLQRQKVFIVLDDVSNSKQLDLLSIKFGITFGLGSRIIVTSRNKQLLEIVGVHVTCDSYVTYKVRELIDDKALQLFSLHAFNQNYPKEGFAILSKEVVHYVNGVPLALRVFGSSLCGKPLESWKGDLKKLKEIPNPDIDDILRISYDGLDKEMKDIFLDIACFFNWIHSDYVKDLLNGCYYSAMSGIRDLIDRSLLTISYNKINMHDLLRQMALNIIEKESNQPSKRSRLWTPEDICPLLKHNTGTESVKAMVLDMSKISGRVSISPKAFERMYKLKILKFYYSDSEREMEPFFENGFVALPDIKGYYHYRDRGEYPSNSERETKLLLENGLVFLPSCLSYLYWDGYPLKSLPSNFCPKNLVELKMPNSHVEQLWDGVQDLVNLKRLDLSYSQSLIKIPDLSKAANLIYISLDGCKKLENFPSSVRLRSLEILDLNGCSNITKFPEIPENVLSLSLDGTAIEEVPSSIERVSKLKHLYLRDCKRLEILPNSICKLKFLESLDLNGCLKLENFPEILETMESLRSLDLSHTSIEELPSSIENLVGLCHLLLSYSEKLKNLPSSIRVLKSLRMLSLDTCSNVIKFPEIPRNLSSLNLSGTSIEKLPSSIDCYTLRELYLDNCTKLCSLPITLKFLKIFRVSGFSKLEVMEELLGTVKVLNIHPSNETAKLVKYASVSLDCSIFAFPSHLMCMSSLTKLNLRGNDFETIPVCIKHLLQLHTLDLRYCERLQSLPLELPPRLRYLDAHNCKSLEAISCEIPFSLDSREGFFTYGRHFMFTNCLKLDQNCINWVKTPLSIEATEEVKVYHEKVKLYHEDYDKAWVGPPCWPYLSKNKDKDSLKNTKKWPNLKSSLSICLPGSKIPEWFSRKSQGSSVTIQLPPHLHDDKFVGIAVCAVLAIGDNFKDTFQKKKKKKKICVSCRYNFKANQRVYSGLLPLWDELEKDSRFIDGDHLFLGYDIKFYSCWYKEESEHHLIEASFEFSFSNSDGDDLSEYCMVKECGVCLLYTQPSSSYEPTWLSCVLNQVFCNTPACVLACPKFQYGRRFTV